MICTNDSINIQILQKLGCYILEAKPGTLGVDTSTHANEFSSESHSQGHCNYSTEI